ncbi:hypothetical protein GQM22_22715 [Escherichia coli]|uniref:hypothetical protein n=1 Tax=Escherichia coli TaxID=562 RepID=UPI0013026AB0|nr:hypothetical protein [Escherichia coli]KAE9822145.1 hypothetical protein GP646_22715 [Escherichia coli]MWK17902.1 hypothetical protein [Escherichia coli]MWK85959.1 hypothetical protein [Escherichia coli]MWL96596.1 hypothetical protein [Escherichia coli]
MIEIPWPLFISIYIVFLIGMVFGKINRYLRICIIILFSGFWFSFDATLTPDITELFSLSTSTSAQSTSATRADIEFVDVLIAISGAVIGGILLYLTHLFIRRVLT